MKKLFFVIPVILLSFAAIAQDKAKTKELDSVMLHWQGLAKFNGTVVVARHGKILLHKGFGIRAVEQGDQVGEKTLYITGESTEMFTSAVIFKLQEEGKLNIKDSLSKYMPDLPNSKKITLEHLLTHRSGIYDYMNNDSFYFGLGVGAPRTKTDILKHFKDKPLLFEPGTATGYSTSDYFLLGIVIEKATGKDYYTNVRNYILTPLGFENSGFNFGGFASWDKAQGYAILNQFRMIPAFPLDSTVGNAGISFFTSSAGLYKWANAVLGKKILKKASWDAMTAVQTDNKAYGWEIKDIAGKKAIGHEGQTYGFLSSFWVVPEDSTVIILLSNDAESETDRIQQNIISILYGQPYKLPKAREHVYLEQRRLEQYEGRYEFENGMDLRVFAKDKLLWGQTKGQAEFTMLADVEADEFYMTTIDVEFRFIRDKTTNQVTHVIIRQNRKETKGRKWQ